MLSNRNLDEIAKQAPALQEVWYSKPKAPLPDLGDAPKSAMPRQVEPMLATPTSRPFDRAGWLFEIKWDGYRAVAEIEANQVRLYSRNQLSLESRFAPLLPALQRFGHDAVVDGEVSVLDESGKPRFQLLQDYQKSRRGQLVYCVFDLLYLAGHDLRKLPLRRRKEILKQVLPSDPQLIFSDHVEEHGKGVFQSGDSSGARGHAGQRCFEPLSDRTKKRLLAQDQKRTAPGGSHRRVYGPWRRPKALSALCYWASIRERNWFTSAMWAPALTKRGFGRFGQKLEPLVQSACPFKKKPPANAPVHWVKPELVCEVSFREWTKDEVMRHPVFLGMRDDRTAKSVHREDAEALPNRLRQTKQTNVPPWTREGSTGGFSPNTNKARTSP